MLLNEFFGKPIDVKKSDNDSNRNKGNINDELFWFILDHDKLHKDYFYPLAKKIKQSLQSESLNKSTMVKEFMPMVKKGCMEYYHKNKLTGKPKFLFSKELRDEICERLYNHYIEDIKKNQHKLEL